jgi:hypothetical protein
MTSATQSKENNSVSVKSEKKNKSSEVTKKTKSAKSVEPVNTEPVTATEPVTEPVTEPATESVNTESVTESVPKVVKSVKSAKGGAKKVKKVAPVAESVKKTSGKSKQVKTAENKTGGNLETEASGEEIINGKRQRSFKVKLPGSSEFTGRFTGLTPYQAGNKALSKYFRTNQTVKPSNTITLEIQESTRNSRKGTYMYEGSRVKLETPVEYVINDGDNQRTIVKEFKNKLIKKKKLDASA